MKSQPDLEERFRAAADRLEVGPPPVERIVRRGRRRLLAKTATSAVLVVVLGGLLVRTGMSLSGFREELRLGDGTRIPKPRVVATIPISGAPWGVAFDGHVWVASYFDDLVAEVDPRTNREVKAIPVPGNPYEVATAGGSVWAGGFSALTRIDPRTHRVANTIHGITRVYTPQAMVAGLSALWLTRHDPSDVGVYRLDPRTGRSATIRLPDPNDLAIGEGSVWVTSCPQGEGAFAPVFRVDPARNQIAGSFVLPIRNECAGAVAVGDGFAYVVTTTTERSADIGFGLRGHVPPGARLLWKFDLDAHRVVAEPLAISPQTGRMVLFRGVLWIVNRGEKGGDDSFVTLVDPTTMRILTRVPVGQNAWRIAAGDSALWVPAMKNGQPVLFRIKP